jgi:hypothetical protein
MMEDEKGVSSQAGEIQYSAIDYVSNIEEGRAASKSPH